MYAMWMDPLSNTMAQDNPEDGPTWLQEWIVGKSTLKKVVYKWLITLAFEAAGKIAKFCF